jgi:hypothetical protein
MQSKLAHKVTDRSTNNGFVKYVVISSLALRNSPAIVNVRANTPCKYNPLLTSATTPVSKPRLNRRKRNQIVLNIAISARGAGKKHPVLPDEHDVPLAGAEEVVGLDWADDLAEFIQKDGGGVEVLGFHGGVDMSGNDDVEFRSEWEGRGGVSEIGLRV